MSDTLLDKILTISGKPGLYKIMTQTRTGVVAISLGDQSKVVTNLGQQVNVLSEIRIYGIKDEVALETIFEKIYRLEKGKQAGVKPKASKDELESYFLKSFRTMTRTAFTQVISKRLYNGTICCLEQGI